MQNSDCFEAINLQKTILTYSGLWPMKKLSFFYKLKRILTWILAISLSFTMLLEAFNNRHDYKILTEVFSLALTPTSYLIKIVIFSINQKKLLVALKHLKQPIFMTYENHLDVYMQKTINKSKMVAKIFQSVCIATALCLCFMPVFGHNNLPLRFSYNLGNYLPAMYVYQVVALIIFVLNDTSVDLLAIAMMDIASTHFRILSEKLINSKQIAIKIFDGESLDDAVNKILYHCVQYHVEILALLDLIQNIFSYIFLVQFLEGIICVCNIGFQVVNVSPTSFQFISMVVYLIAKLQEVGIYCWYGNDVIEESSQLGIACYKSEWYDCGSKVRKTLFLIMERSKCFSTLTAGKFSILSLATYMGILQSSYSYFALMQRLYKDSEGYDATNDSKI